MTAEQVVIAVIRLASAFPVLRWPLAGALLAVAADLSDLLVMDLLHLGGVPDYQRFDKLLDLGYMATFMVVAARWTGTERRVAAGLLAFRLVGLVAFEVTGERTLLLAFPNVFEFWFILVAARRKRGLPALTGPAAAVWLGGLAAVKEAQEYAIHYGRWLDRYTFLEFWALVWRTLTRR